MPELSKYGFRSDKAKEPFADETTIDYIKTHSLDFEILHAKKLPIAANSGAVWPIYSSAKSLPMPIVNLMTARKQSDLYSIVQQGIMFYVFASNVGLNFGVKSRSTVVYIYNANDFPVYVWMNAQVFNRPYGEDFPDGQAWDVNILDDDTEIPYPT